MNKIKHTALKKKKQVVGPIRPEWILSSRGSHKRPQRLYIKLLSCFML